MLARGAGVRPAIPLEPLKEGPNATDLAIPEDVLASAPPAKLIQLVQQSQEHRIKVASTFDDIFEHLVTGGRADEYSGLCERFKERFDAISNNLERAASLLAEEPQIAAMIRAINKDEATRLEKQMKLQVVRQHHSIAEAESDEAVSGKQHIHALEAEIKQLMARIYDTLDELRCEAADL